MSTKPPRCPECREERIWIMETSTVTRRFDVSDLDKPHAVTPTDGPISLHPCNSFEATCMRCNYTWNIRVSSIEKAKAANRVDGLLPLN